MKVIEEKWTRVTLYNIVDDLHRGSIQLEVYNNPEDEVKVYISNLWVLPEYRGQGIAKALLDKAEEIAKTQTDEEYVYLCYWSADTPGGVYKYYLKRGYDDYKWGCPGEPIVMRKKLR